MGGKDKQRTKGNLKPSSSGRAAELMAKGGAVGFVGFGGLGSQGEASLGYVPMATGSGEDVDSTVDGDFRMTMRKLMKRDGITKLKAVQEFSELCRNLPTESVESALPFWPRLYNKLAVDNDHRVREATQQAMEQMVLRVRRNLAPHLRAVIGSWLCCQFDTYAPVASAAERAFAAAFSEEKQAEAIMFCRKELVEFFRDNILNQTPATLSDPKFVPEEEMEAKYIRVVASSILALGHVISVASDDVNTNMETEYAILFKQNKFWKFARHKSPNIRAAIFSLVGTSGQRLPGLLNSFASSACPALFSALDNTEPVVCQQLWAGVLSVVQHVQDCWLHVNPRKAVLPKLWALLRSGGNGSAAVIYPNLLPFLSKIPSEVIGPEEGFYKEFFQNFLEGLKKEKVLNIASECAAVVTAFFECLRFSLLRTPAGCTGQDTGNGVQEYLVKEQLLPLVKMSLEKKSKLASSPLYELLRLFLARVSGDSPVCPADQLPNIDGNAEGVAITLGKIREWFWEDFGALCHECLLEDENSKVGTDTLDSLSHCLVCLKSPSRKKTKQRVSFTDSNSDSAKPGSDHCDVSDTGLSIKPLNNQSDDIDVEQLYKGRLIDLICSICKSCLVQLKASRRVVHVRFFASVVPAFVCTRLLETLVTNYCDDTNGEAPCSGSYDDLCCSFIFSRVLPWTKPDLRDLPQDVLWNQQAVEFCVEIICGVVRTLPDERQTAVISKIFEENKDRHFLDSMLKKGHLLRLRGLTGWLQSAAAGARAVSLAQSLALGRQQLADGERETEEVLTAEERRTTWMVLQFWLTNDSPGFVLSAESMDSICKHFLCIINQTQERSVAELPTLLGILQNYMTKCKEGLCETVAALEDLFLAVYKLQLADTNIDAEESVAETLVKTWQSAVRLFRDSPPSTSDCETLLIKAGALILDNVSRSGTVESLEALAQQSLKSMQESDDLAELSDGENGFSSRHVWPHVVPEEEEFARLRLQSGQIPWLAVPLINGQITAVSSPLTSCSESDTSCAGKNLTRHQKISLYCAQLLKASTQENTHTFTGDSNFVRLLLEVLWMQELYANTEPSKNPWLQETHRTAKVLLLRARERGWHGQLFTAAYEKSKQEGFLWSLVLGAVLREFQGVGGVPEMDADVLLSEVQEAALVEETWFHTLTSVITELQGIYEVKLLTNRCTELLRREASETSFAFILATLSASLERWSTLTGDREDAVLELQATLGDVFDQLLLWKQENDVMLLLNSPTEDASSSVVSINLALVKMFRLAVRCAPGHIKASHWDFILCSLIGWLQTCEESRSSLPTSLPCLVLCYHVCTLHASVARFFKANLTQLQQASKTDAEPANPDVTEPREHGRASFPPNLLNEWEEFFGSTAYGILLSVFLDYAGRDKPPFDPAVSRLSEALGSAVIFTPLPLLKTHKYERPPLACAADSSLPQWAQDLLAECVPLLTSPVHGLQFAAYNLLQKVMPELAACVTQKVDRDQESEESRSPPDILMATLETSSLRMTEILADAGVSFGEHLSMADDAEAQNVSLSLLLAFKLLLRFFTATSQELRAEYATFLRRNTHVSEFLGILFRVMPMRMTGVRVRQDYEPVVGEPVGEGLVQELACHVFYSLVQCMPAIVRQWWTALDKRQSAVVDKFVTSHITPLLCEREVELVENSPVKYDNMQVKTRPSAREVAAVYTMDEISMEMVVKLAPNHPLGAVAVDSGKRIGVNTSQWRSWMLQLTTFLMHQNGSIMDGLGLWKRNVDKRFEGVDDCMICFSVIHGTNYSLPKLSCKTCKKKFHSVCLYKWFSKSNNSTCPLCRNLF